MTIPPPQSDPRVRPPEARRQLLIRLAFLAGLVVVGGILAWRYGLQMVALARDEVALEAFVAGLGWWGPLFLVTLNAIQIVVAPIPGYAAQLAAGVPLS